MNLNQQIEDWFITRKATLQSARRPFVTLAYAQSWDGSITTRRGEVLPLSGAQSTRLTHQLRSLHDGILVGIGTVLTDDPQLTVREWTGPNPQPIVVDSLLRMPQTAKLFHHPDKQCWILSVRPCNGQFGNQAEVLTLNCRAEDRQQVPLIDALELLREKGIATLMVEGGAKIITAFLKAGLADAIVMTIAPRLIGGYKAVGNLGAIPVNRLPRLDPLHFEKLGNDLIVWGDLQYGNSST
jgi:diaminohydroxyphosphoribosylaminopyrimidine deaminase/5-amino-6-(5-phosphoribosylamino)uracil reductase